MRARWIFPLLLVAAVLSACAAGPNTAEPATSTGAVAGFWLGLWHGLITPVTFVVSLFNQQVNIYEVINNGGWYNFGFLIGVSIIFSSGPVGVSTRSRSHARS